MWTGGAGSGHRRADWPPRQVDWPLNIVVTEGCLSRYSGIFSFLLQLKLMMWTLKDVCFHLKRTGEPSGGGRAQRTLGRGCRSPPPPPQRG